MLSDELFWQGKDSYCLSINGLFPLTLRCMINFILGISNICTTGITYGAPAAKFILRLDLEEKLSFLNRH